MERTRKLNPFQQLNDLKVCLTSIFLTNNVVNDVEEENFLLIRDRAVRCKQG